MEPKKYRPKVQALLYNDLGQILASKSQAEGSGLRAYPNYKFPGGGVEPGESLVEAARKELLEEAGYEPAEDPEDFGYTPTKVDWDEAFKAQALAKGRDFDGEEQFYMTAPVGGKAESLLGSEGDQMTGLEFVDMSKLRKALQHSSKDPSNEYSYFDVEKLKVLDQLKKHLDTKGVKTASDKLLRHRATVMVRDPATGRVLVGKEPAGSKASPYFFPGGGLYEDEYDTPRTPTEEEIIEGARREALEELGIELDNPRVVGGYGQELEDWWKSKTLKNRGVPYLGGHEHYVLADKGKQDSSLYNVEGDAFEQGDYYDPEEVYKALSGAAKSDSTFAPFNREQARILKEHFMNKTSSDKNLKNIKDKLRVAILSGSTGNDPEELSRSRALAETYKDYLTSHGAEVDWMDMRNMDDMPDTYDWETDWYDDYKKRLTDADAFVVSTPIFNYGPSGRVLQFLHRTLDKENQQFKPYALLSGAGSPRSALALGGLANQLDTEIKGIGIGGGVQVAGDEFDTETGEMNPGIITRANENAAKLLQVAGALRNKTSSHNSPYMQAYLAGIKLAEAQFDDYQSVSDPDGFDEVTTKSDSEDPKKFRSTSYSDRSTPATNNYSTSGRNQSTHAKQPDEVTPDQTFATNSPKRDRLRGKYNG